MPHLIPASRYCVIIPHFLMWQQGHRESPTAFSKQCGAGIQTQVLFRRDSDSHCCTLWSDHQADFPTYASELTVGILHTLVLYRAYKLAVLDLSKYQMNINKLLYKTDFYYN